MESGDTYAPYYRDLDMWLIEALIGTGRWSAALDIGVLDPSLSRTEPPVMIFPPSPERACHLEQLAIPYEILGAGLGVRSKRLMIAGIWFTFPIFLGVGVGVGNEMPSLGPNVALPNNSNYIYHQTWLAK